MIPKVNRSVGFDRLTFVCALLGIFLGATLNVYFHGSGVNIHGALEVFVELPAVVMRSTTDFILKLAIKFLHFLISKWMEFRVVSLSPIHPPPFPASAVFWVSLTRSVSDMFLEPLQ